MSYRPHLFTLPEDDVWPGDEALSLRPYVFDENTRIAVDVAIAARRPLLVAGPPGSGKSMLAPAMAALLGYRFLPLTLTSRTRLETLTGELDHLRRLHDAQAARKGDPVRPQAAYLEPGLLWWAFAPDSAARRGLSEAERDDPKNAFVAPRPPSARASGAPGTGAVILLDEIDKAEPDLPNDLLEPLDHQRFQVPNGPAIAAPEGLQVLTIITTNGEREMPPAFLRRCVSLVLAQPKPGWLTNVGRRHFPEASEELLSAAATKVGELRDEARREGLKLPSTSEYLDAVRACLELEPEPARRLAVLDRVAPFTMLKRTGYDDDD